MLQPKPYIVVHRPTGHARLVEAKTKSAARSAAASHDYEVRQPSYKELLDYGAKGERVIYARAQDELPLSSPNGSDNDGE